MSCAVGLRALPPRRSDDVQIRIEGSNLPGSACGPSPDRPGGYRGIHVGLQRRNRPEELLGLVRGDSPSATWTVDCDGAGSPDGFDFKGPYVQGPPGGRFLYLSWVTVDLDGNQRMFRRAKLWLEAVPRPVADRASELGLLVGRLGLTDPKGNPLCASVRPPRIEWTA
jgi:hypothetical protein